MMERMRAAGAICFAAMTIAMPAAAADALQLSGFAALRAANAADGVPLDDDTLNAQVQLGIDWQPSLALAAHLHLLARSDEDGSRRGRAGIVQAYLEQNVVRG